MVPRGWVHLLFFKHCLQYVVFVFTTTVSVFSSCFQVGHAFDLKSYFDESFIQNCFSDFERLCFVAEQHLNLCYGNQPIFISKRSIITKTMFGLICLLWQCVSISAPVTSVSAALFCCSLSVYCHWWLWEVKLGHHLMLLFFPSIYVCPPLAKCMEKSSFVLSGNSFMSQGSDR